MIKDIMGVLCMDDKNNNMENINLNSKIVRIDNLVDEQKYKIKKIDELQEQITSLNKNLNMCIALLARAINGPTTQNMFNDMYENNQSFYANMANTLDDELVDARKTIDSLSKEKDELIKEFKKEIKEEE